jgi:prepilin-type N-terminal cleavage/methylation domain-containing protein
MLKKSGFSLIELLVVLAVIAVITAVTVPSVISWRNGAKFRGAVNNLKGDLQMAKVKAVKENDVVTIFFTSTGYKVILDTANHWVHDADEPVLKRRELPAGVSFDLDNTDFGSVGDKTRFNSRGNSVAGHALLVDTYGDQKKLVVTRVGQIKIE